MATIIQSKEQQPKENHRITTCPMCHSIIDYTLDDVHYFQLAKFDYIFCPKCRDWIGVKPWSINYMKI